MALTLQWADDNNLLSRSAPKIRQLTQGDGRIRWLSKDVELPAFKKTLASCSDDDLRAFISIAFFTGCRAGEILALQWKKFDFQRQTVRFEKTKADNARTVSLSGCWDTVEPLIERWDNDPAAFVFTNADGTPPYNYHPRFDRFRKAAGLQDFTFHDLRHNAASYLAMASTPLADIAYLLGHKSIQTTMRYAHLDPSQNVKTGGALADIINLGSP